MAKLRDEAEDYESKMVHNIADLEEVDVDLELYDDTFTIEEDDGSTKEKPYKYIVKDDARYREPKSVLKQLKVHLEDNPELKTFKVKKSGKGMNTDYTVIPLQGKSEEVKDKD